MEYKLSKLEHAKIAEEAIVIMSKIISPTFSMSWLSSNDNGDITIGIGYYKDMINLMSLSELSSSFLNNGNKSAISCCPKHIAISFFKCLPSKKSLMLKIPLIEDFNTSIIL